VVAAVADAEALLRAVDEHQPDVAIVDARMPPPHTNEGLRAALVLRRQWPNVAVLVLSQYVEERYATELLSSDAKGAGYRSSGPNGWLVIGGVLTALLIATGTLAVTGWLGYRAESQHQTYAYDANTYTSKLVEVT
jgi:CheY-like chemotaxis protein